MLVDRQPGNDSSVCPILGQERTLATLLGLFLAALLNSACVGTGGDAHGATGSAQDLVARAGSLDLRSWVAGRDGPVELSGEWRFAWSELVDPTEDCSLRRYPELLELPGLWSDEERDGARLPASGHATFCLTVLLDPQPEPLLLEVGRVRTSGRLWVNGRLAAAMGTVGESIEASRPRRIDRFAVIEPSARVDLVLQVSNYHFRAGGAHRALRLGSVADLEPLPHAVESSLTMLFTGAFVILGIYHLIIFTIRREGQEPLFFGLLCLCMAAYQLTRENNLFAALLPGVDWQVEIRAEYSLFAAAVALAGLYIRKMYPREFSSHFVRLCVGVSVLFVIAVWVLPTRVVSDRILAAYQIVFFSLGLFGVWGLIRALRNRRPGALLFAIGGSMWVLSGLADGLLNRVLPGSPRLLPYGFMALIVAQAVLLAIVQIRATNRAEELSTRLLGLASEKLALEQMAYRDPLTGLENRRRLQLGAQELRAQLDSDGIELEPRARSDETETLPISLLYFDVDDFKEVNDRFGHEVGDAVLVAIADLIRDEFRSFDLSVRLGGDEFAVLLAGVDEEQARAQAARLGKRLEEPLAVSGERLRISVSVGVASTSGRAMDLSDLLRRADQDMYRAKSRNKTVDDLGREARSHVGAVT